ncbi:MAG: hypothetical protein EA344_03065 [Alkalicoccus sp.]|nr:MAG: hypothetical protein EA344_03065 [Alkalicoccus sp.]
MKLVGLNRGLTALHPTGVSVVTERKPSLYRKALLQSSVGIGRKLRFHSAGLPWRRHPSAVREAACAAGEKSRRHSKNNTELQQSLSKKNGFNKEVFHNRKLLLSLLQPQGRLRSD